MKMLREIGAFLFLGNGMDQQSTGAAIPRNDTSTLHDLFALTDEQILEIEPEAQDVELSNAPSPARTQQPSQVAPASLPAGSPSAPQNEQSRLEAGATQVSASSFAEPPAWLAAQMKDPWNGEAAQELWNGVQQAKSEAAAYRAAFTTPEDARALKELYPGGVNEARAAAERARILDDIDRAYLGAAGKSAQEVSASRAQLAQKMLHEDPVAFREMVFAGLRALEDVGNQPGAAAAEAIIASRGNNGAAAGGASPAPTATTANGTPDSRTTEHDARLAAYASFEKAANEDLERSVGASIDRTLAQALPNASRVANDSGVGAQHPDQIGTGAAPLQARLSQAIRQDIEAALKGDRQLTEQVAQILSAHRFDNETRGQVVRLIAERAQQLVPVAAKRVLNDWTQTTLAAHRGKSAQADASTRREVAPVSPESRRASPPAGSSAGSNRSPAQNPNRTAARSDPRRVDYRKLSDEQILDL
jgi:hypothetical protein